MHTIDRTAAVVRPKEPYFDWARRLDDQSPTIDDLSRDDLSAVFLIKESDDPAKELHRQFKVIFDEMLSGWDQDESSWPSKRDYRLFQKWFDVSLFEIVFDTGKWEIERE